MVAAFLTFTDSSDLYSILPHVLSIIGWKGNSEQKYRLPIRVHYITCMCSNSFLSIDVLKKHIPSPGPDNSKT